MLPAPWRSAGAIVLVSCLLLIQAAAPAAAAAAKPQLKMFKAIGDYLGYKPAPTDTVFAPSDEAFAAFAKSYGLKGASEFMSPKWVDLITRVGAYHISPAAAVKASALRDGQRLPTIEGDALTIAKSANGKLSVKGTTNAAAVIAADAPAGGGAALHVIDAVLIPPGVYTTLLAALTARNDTSIWGSFMAADPIGRGKAADPGWAGTYFAPSDAGLAKYAKVDGIAKLADAFGGPANRGVYLAYHSSPVAYGLGQLKALPSAARLPSGLSVGGVAEPIFHGAAPGGGVDLWGLLNLKDRATIVVKDLLAGAGVMHVVDFPLLPDVAAAATASIANVVNATKGLSRMALLLERTGIFEELDSPFFSGTLFAPTDEAFAEFAKKLGFAKVDAVFDNEPLMDALLAYHLLPVAYPADKLARFAPFAIKPFGGGVLRFKRAAGAGSAVTVAGDQNSASVVRAGLDAGRSVVHVIDSVLLPDNVFPSIMAALEFFPSTSILQNLVDATPEIAALASDPKSAVTMFAPRNEAFFAMGDGFVDMVELANATRLGGLAYHVSPGAARLVPAGFASGAPLPTLLEGQRLGVRVAVVEDGASKEKVGKITLLPTGGPAADIIASNIIAGQSVIQGVSRVLIPKEVDGAVLGAGAADVPSPSAARPAAVGQKPAAPANAARKPAAAAATAPKAAGAPRRLAQFADSATVPGTHVLRTNFYSRLSASGASALASNDFQSAVQNGDTSLIVDTQATWTAGRSSREIRAMMAQGSVQSAIQSGTAASASRAGGGAANLWAANGSGSNSAGMRASMASEATQAAVRAALDRPNDAFRATRTGSVQASVVTWPTSYTNMT